MLISRILDIPYSTVWNIIRKFQTTKEVADLPRTGRPRCMRIPKKIKAIRERVRRNPKRSMKKITSEVGISNSSMHRLIHKDLKKFWSKEMWPPCSPDLNSLDFSVWRILESKLCAKKRKNIETLKNSLGREWEKLSQSLLRAICNDVPRRLKDVISNNGGHIE